MTRTFNTLQKTKISPERNCSRTSNFHHRVQRVISHLESLSICAEIAVYIRKLRVLKFLHLLLSFRPSVTRRHIVLSYFWYHSVSLHEQMCEIPILRRAFSSSATLYTHSVLDATPRGQSSWRARENDNANLLIRVLRALAKRSLSQKGAAAFVYRYLPKKLTQTIKIWRKSRDGRNQNKSSSDGKLLVQGDIPRSHLWSQTMTALVMM